MKALTLWPEWAWAIAHLDKRVENRLWAAKHLVGERIAIHAGKHIGGRSGRPADEEGIVTLMCAAEDVGWSIGVERRRPPDPEVRLSAHRPGMVIPANNIPPTPVACGAFVATARLADCVHASQTHLRSWAAPDCWHFVLAEVIPLATPIPAKGAQGFWEVSPADMTRFAAAPSNPLSLDPSNPIRRG